MNNLLLIIIAILCIIFTVITIVSKTRLKTTISSVEAYKKAYGEVLNKYNLMQSAYETSVEVITELQKEIKELKKPKQPTPDPNLPNEPKPDPKPKRKYTKKAK